MIRKLVLVMAGLLNVFIRVKRTLYSVWKDNETFDQNTKEKKIKDCIKKYTPCCLNVFKEVKNFKVTFVILVLN